MHLGRRDVASGLPVDMMLTACCPEVQLHTWSRPSFAASYRFGDGLVGIPIHKTLGVGV